MKIDVDVSGLGQLTAQLQKLANDADDVVIGVITDAVTDTQADAVARIAGPPKSGRVYRRGNVTHRASAPGQYPATDTGALVSQVEIRLPVPGRMEGMVGTNLVYGKYLEFGTSRMAARPWLLPSFKRATRNLAKELKARLEGQV